MTPSTLFVALSILVLSHQARAAQNAVAQAVDAGQQPAAAARAASQAGQNDASL